MTPEERKAIAMRQQDVREAYSMFCQRNYPQCCSYHEGFDDALALLVLRAYEHPIRQGYHRAHSILDDDCPVEEGRRALYAIEGES